MSTEQVMDEPSARRSALPWFIGIVAALIFALVIGARISTDLWWFQTVDFATVFTTRLVAQLVLFLGFGLIMFAIMFGSLLIAYRLRPKVRRANLDSELLIQARDLLDGGTKIILAVPAGVAGLCAGLSALQQVDTFLAAWRAHSFGQKDPYFGLDASFYIFQLPWMKYAVSFLLVAVVLATLGALIVHFLTGSMTVKALSKTGNTQQNIGAHRQLSVLAGDVMLTLSDNAYLGRFAYLTSQTSK